MGTLAEALNTARLELEPTERDRSCLGLPRLDPRLLCTYQPWRMTQAAEPDPEGDLIASIRRDLAARWDRDGLLDLGPAEGVAPLGLSEARSPQKEPIRHGKKGLTAAGARNVQRACAVLNDDRALLAFWTVTLPDETLRQMLTADLWPEFQSRVRDLLVRALKAAGLPARVVGVVELHPGRSMRERLPLPHMHVVFQGRSNSRERWRLSTAKLDGLIRDAVRYVGLPAPDVKAAGNVQPVRRNAGGYLSKYMTKARQQDWLDRVPGLLPKVWWFWSAELRQEVGALVLEIGWRFVVWLHRLGRDGCLPDGVVWVRLELPDPRAPSTYLLRFARPAALRRALNQWKGLDGPLNLG